jgi:hypothetical protein
MVAVNETSTIFIGIAIVLLAQHRDQLVLLAEHPELLAQAIDEVNRRAAPIQFDHRKHWSTWRSPGSAFRRGRRLRYTWVQPTAIRRCSRIRIGSTSRAAARSWRRSGTASTSVSVLRSRISRRRARYVKCCLNSCSASSTSPPSNRTRRSPSTAGSEPNSFLASTCGDAGKHGIRPELPLVK